MTMKFQNQKIEQVETLAQADVLTGLMLVKQPDGWSIAYELGSTMWGYVSNRFGDKKVYKIADTALNAISTIQGYDLQFMKVIEPNAPLEDFIFPEQYELTQEK